MKTFRFFLFVCLSATFVYGQEIPYNDDKKIEFREIIELKDKISKNQVLERVKKWASSYWAAPNLLNSSDKSISYRASFVASRNLVLTQDTYEIFYKLKVGVKDNKYRYTLSDFEVVRLGLMKYPLEKKIKKKKIKEAVLTETKSLIKSLKSAIENGNVENKKDDW